jgi:hypothetical protein
MQITAFFIALSVVALHAQDDAFFPAENSTGAAGSEGSNGKEQNEGMFEGDMRGYTPPNNKHRAAMKDKTLKWPGGKVPYMISNDFDSAQRAFIEAAFVDFAKLTCIKFVPRTGSEYYLNIKSVQGCWSMIGRMKGKSRKFERKQDLSLEKPDAQGRTCLQKGVIQHELMHALGFIHEQSRPDRDQYVTINWQYIKDKAMNGNFQKQSASAVTTQGTEYDYGSLMHYEHYAFGVNPNDRSKDTITAKNGAPIGQRDGMSPTDLKEINMWYQCPGKVGGGGGDNPGDVGGGPVGGESNASCKDSNRFCIYWSMIGECKKNPGFMLSGCKKSCDQC